MSLMSFSSLSECPFLFEVWGYPPFSGKFVDFIILLVIIFTVFLKRGRRAHRRKNYCYKKSSG